MLRFVRIRVSGRVLGIAAVLTAAATLVGAAVPAQAATLGWRQVFSKHYGAAGDYSIYGAVVAPSRSSAWMLGGADESGGNGTTQRALAVHWNGHAWSSTFLLPATSYVIAASADSATDVWAVTFLGGYVLHWNGSKWLVAKHLTGAGELTGVTALSPANVWVAAVANGGGGPAYLVHFNGAGWTRIKVPGSGIQVNSPAPDGLGGLWLTGRTTNGTGYFIHRGAGGTWSAFAANGLPLELAPIPGTRSLWGAGSKQVTTNRSAVIWAYGTV